MNNDVVIAIQIGDGVTAAVVATQLRYPSAPSEQVSCGVASVWGVIVLWDGSDA